MASTPRFPPNVDAVFWNVTAPPVVVMLMSLSEPRLTPSTAIALVPLITILSPALSSEASEMFAVPPTSLPSSIAAPLLFCKVTSGASTEPFSTMSFSAPKRIESCAVTASMVSAP